MIDSSLYLTYLAACVAVVIVPGPTVTVIIANALRHGPRAGLANVAGTQAGLAVMLAVLAFGLRAIIDGLGQLFDVIKLIGAAYLIWLGLRMLRQRTPVDPQAVQAMPAPSMRRFFTQGVLVIWSNPKALLFFGAFIPQFLDPAGPILAQTLLLGGTFMAVATLLDGGYALLAGRAGQWLTARRVRVLEGIGGGALIGGGLWLAAARGPAAP